MTDYPTHEEVVRAARNAKPWTEKQIAEFLAACKEDDVSEHSEEGAGSGDPAAAGSYDPEQQGQAGAGSPEAPE